MKISYRTHPALKFLDEGLSSMTVGLDDKEHFELRCKNFSNVSECFEENKDEFKKNVSFISKPFYEAVTLAFEKMLSPELSEGGVANAPSGTLIAGYHTIYYTFANNQFVCFGFHADMLVFLIRGGDNQHISFFSEGYYKVLYGEHYEYKLVIPYIIRKLIVTLNFIKYAEVQTKHVVAGQKVKGVACKYVNDTKIGITFLDSKWFTTLVKSDAFKVRGHFRLQPKKKDGEWTKELIWINEFQKEGYTAPAKMLNQ
jgi:hypothetical protein